MGRIVAEGTPDELGRDDATALVSFREPAFHEGLPVPDGATVSRGVVQFRTVTPTRDLAPLLEWAAGRGMELEHLTVTRPTLEDVYLDLTATPEEVAA
jgi:ABC-2 type transport system ATP-binding protein